MTALRRAIELFHETAPARPYCTDDPRDGQYRMAREKAMQRRHIQPNTSGRVVLLCFDVDRAGAALDWNDLSAPPPTLVMENPKNGHAHLAYALEAPVARGGAARYKPQLYLASVSEGVRRKIQADIGYSGGLIKTPGHEAWRTTSYAGAYSLADLADWVTLPTPAELLKRARDPDYAEMGRNCWLFEMLRAYGYKAIRNHWGPAGFEAFALDMESHAYELARFNSPRDPLPDSEARAVAKSLARWIWQRFTPAGFRSHQSAMGKRKGAKERAKGLDRAVWLSAMGATQREIAADLGVSQKTVSNWLQRAKPCA